MKQFNIHGCTHFQRKALVTEAMQQQAPPNNLIQFNNEYYKWREEIRELKKQIEAAQFNTDERQHHFSLLNELALNRKIPEEVRTEAINAVIKFAREEFEEIKRK